MYIPLWLIVVILGLIGWFLGGKLFSLVIFRLNNYHSIGETEKAAKELRL